MDLTRSPALDRRLWRGLHNRRHPGGVLMRVLLAACVAVTLGAGLINGPPTSAETDDSATLLLPGVWNQITWEGPEVGLRGAFRVIPEIEWVAIHDVAEDQWRVMSREGPLVAGWLRPGETVYLWISGEAPMVWQPEPYVPPIITFSDAVPASANRTHDTRAITAFMDFVAERAGVRASGLTVHIMQSGNSFACAYSSERQEIRIPFGLGGHCIPSTYGSALGKALTRGRDHTVQTFLEWLVAGTAHYFEVWHENAGLGAWTPEQRRTFSASAMRDVGDAWPMGPHATRSGYPDPSPNPVLSTEAVGHLMSLIGEEAFLEGLSRPLASPSFPPEACWQFPSVCQSLVFQEAFGLSLETFYASFATYRRTFGTPWPSISGRIVSPSSRQLVRYIDFALATGVARTASEEHVSNAMSDRDGKFRITVRGGDRDHILFIYPVNFPNYLEGAMPSYRSTIWALCSTRDTGQGHITNLTINLSDQPAPNLPEDFEGQARVLEAYYQNIDALPDCAELGSQQ